LPIIARFGREGGEVILQDDGGWSISCDYALATWAGLLEGAPARVDEIATARTPLLDGYGNDVEDEMTFGVSVCNETRTVVTWSEHWQAGLSLTLSVSASDDAHRAVVASARAWITEVSDPDTEEGAAAHEAWVEGMNDADAVSERR
jgi:hypothetical protein